MLVETDRRHATRVARKSEVDVTASPRRVALVGPMAPPAGGMANQTAQLVELLGLEGIEVTFIPVNPPYRPAWIGKIRGVRALLRLIPYCVGLVARVKHADVVHVMASSGWSWHLLVAPAVWIARLARIPAVVHYHGGQAEAFLGSSLRVVRPTLRAAACLLIVPSQYLKEVFARHGLSAEVVPNVVDTSLFRKPNRVTCGTSPHIIVTRNLEPIYDNSTAIRAFALVREALPDARLSVAGSGPERVKLEALASSLGIAKSVRFLGRLDKAEIAALYGDANLMLNPSKADNMPVSILEAMASGVPVVTTNVGGIPFLVKHEKTGILVNPGDEAAMAAAALRVLRDEELYERLASAGVAESEQFTWPRVRGALFEVYRRLALPDPMRQPWPT